MANRNERRAKKVRAQTQEQQRRQAGANREPGPEEFGLKMPPLTARGNPAQRPDFSNADWDKLRAAYPRDADRLKRAMFIAFVGERAKQAHAFMAWGLRPNLTHPQSDSPATTLR